MRVLTRVGRRMSSRGTSVLALSRATNIHPTRLFYVRGGFIPRPDEAQRIATALRTTVSKLWPALREFGDEGDAPASEERRA
jgi:hypothetical protein